MDDIDVNGFLGFGIGDSKYSWDEDEFIDIIVFFYDLGV